MGNRKLPFGYQMRMGEIIQNELEAKAVQDIFLQYTFGASLKEIAEQKHCLVRGNELDYVKASNLLLEDFRSGKLGRLTLEYPEVQDLA